MHAQKRYCNQMETPANAGDVWSGSVLRPVQGRQVHRPISVCRLHAAGCILACLIALDTLLSVGTGTADGNDPHFECPKQLPCRLGIQSRVEDPSKPAAAKTRNAAPCRSQC